MIQLCHKIAIWVSESLSLNDERRQVIEYGLLGLIQMAAILSGVVFFGALFGFLPEAIVIFFAVGLLRKNTGGAHAGTLTGCTVMSIGVICVLSALCRYGLIRMQVWVPAVVLLVLFYGVSFFQVYRKVPMDTPNKPITKPEKISRLRRGSFCCLGIYAAVSGALILWGGNRGVSIAFAVSCAMLWQVFTLTRLGAALIHAIDGLFC